jgi:pimeloyl-ACP methyl ester carboxylesterase
MSPPLCSKNHDLTNFLVLEAALAEPQIVRKLILAGTRASVPSSGPIEGIIWPQEQGPSEFVTKLASAVTLEEGRDGLQYSCFPLTDRSRAAFDRYWSRLQARTAEKPQLELLSMDPNGNNQIATLMDSNTTQPGSSFDRLGELKMPVLVMNGDTDVLVPTSRSWELLKQIENAQLIIYPKSGHGFLWEYAERVGEDVVRFLDGVDFE